MFFCMCCLVFFFKQKTSYEMRISDWSSDLCSSDLLGVVAFSMSMIGTFLVRSGILTSVHAFAVDPERGTFILALLAINIGGALTLFALRASTVTEGEHFAVVSRSEEHTSELQSLMRISYAVFCLKKKTKRNEHTY